MSVVHISYYTDPACPWSWALEPAVHRLAREYGQSVRFDYVMCGMAKQIGDPGTLLAESLEAGVSSGMPVDGRLWLVEPPRSTHPACMAVKAAAEQGDPAPYLRRLREGFMCRRLKLDTAEALVQEARLVPGLDVERFRIDLGSHAILEAFAADLDRATAVPSEHHAPGAQRPPLPSFELTGADGMRAGVYGATAFEQLDQAAVGTGAERTAAPAPGVLEALRSAGTMATAEVAAVCALPGPRAPAELWRLAAEWRIRPERLGSGELWTLA